MGNNGEEYPCIIEDVLPEKLQIGEGVSTLVHYDIDVLYDKEHGMHDILKHVHSSLVHKISLKTNAATAYFYSAWQTATNTWQVIRKTDDALIAFIENDCIHFTEAKAAYGSEDLTEIAQLMRQMAIPA